MRNSINGNEECTIWDRKQYEANEFKLSSKNNLLILDEELIEICFSNPELKPIHFSEGVLIKHEGNAMGLYINPGYNFKKYKRQDKKAFEILTGGDENKLKALIGSVGYYLWFYRDSMKRIKLELLFVAINKFRGEIIEKFLRGERLD